MGDRAWMRWGFALGFALSGFFDCILLHQVLQWHHLLSLVEGVGDLRAQVLWDGLFHLAMYGIAALALGGLWRAHRAGGGVERGRLLGALLLGFGAWHGVDAALSHWLLGLHRIRLDAAAPLAWDLGWLAAFGLLPAAGGWALLRWGGGGRGGDGGGGAALLALLALLTFGAGGWAAQGSRTGGPEAAFAAVVFRPGLGTAEVVAALAAADARLVGGDPRRGVIVVEAAPERRWSFYRNGALLVGGAGLPAGCLGWSRA